MWSMIESEHWKDYLHRLGIVKDWEVLKNGLPVCGSFFAAIRCDGWEKLQGYLVELKAAGL